MANRSFLGRGFSFPFRFSPVGGLKKTIGVSITEDVDKVNSSIYFILSTQIGERAMRRDFGSGLREMVFSPNDPAFDSQIEFIVNTSIEKWERRIIVNTVLIDRSMRKDGVLYIQVTYTIIKSNVVGNLVYPFYITDSTDNSLLPQALS